MYPELVLNALKLENTIISLEEEGKHAFLDFVAGHILCWDPEERTTAKELLQHPWLRETVLPWQKEEASLIDGQRVRLQVEKIFRSGIALRRATPSFPQKTPPNNEDQAWTRLCNCLFRFPRALYPSAECI